MGLLDDILKGHAKKREDVDQLLEARQKAEADAKALAAEEQRKKDKKWADAEAKIQRGHRPWLGDPNHSVAGIHHGGIFEFSGCGPGLDGRYVVVKVEIFRNQGKGEPRLWAARDDGQPPKPPYIEMYESAVREEIGFERLKVIKAIPDAMVFEPEGTQRDRDALVIAGAQGSEPLSRADRDLPVGDPELIGEIRTPMGGYRMPASFAMGVQPVALEPLEPLESDVLEEPVQSEPEALEAPSEVAVAAESSPVAEPPLEPAIVLPVAVAKAAPADARRSSILRLLDED